MKIQAYLTAAPARARTRIEPAVGSFFNSPNLLYWAKPGSLRSWRRGRRESWPAPLTLFVSAFFSSGVAVERSTERAADPRRLNDESDISSRRRKR